MTIDDDRDRDDDYPETCPICGSWMDWQDCDGCEDGYIDEAEDDPINFAPGEF